MTNTSDLISERAATHGDYGDNARVAQVIKRILQSEGNWLRLTDVQKESLDLIATKIGRIMSGNPHAQDHWDDIAGYAKLAANEIAANDPAAHA